MTVPEIIFASKYGFCGGVARALALLDEALARFGAPVYVYHKIVHNERVAADLRARGVVFVDSLDEAADVSRPLVLSAHGSSLALVAEVARRGFANVIDAVCPLVGKIHEYVRAKVAAGYDVIVIGSDAGHDEVVGTMGQAEGGIYFVSSGADIALLPPMEKVCFVSQTTLAKEVVREVAATIRARFTGAETLSEAGVCGATSERQDAVRELVVGHGLCDIIVIGSATSSNTKNLARVAMEAGATNVWLVGSAEDINFDMPARIGITAGASTPQVLIDEIVAKLNGFSD
ncbi:MAG: 4-hydroxy-3-methylbut-2-enyl diphosphate reductase [Alphaproteobacteria bacterium]|nr:4-hydroxy-3-methylbut-2-enyl diphosphate reductase [Alphaproteobacteria bacterium]